MFTIQITSIESQRQTILSQIEELKRQEQVLVQESLQYREMEDEATSLLGAIASLLRRAQIASLKNKFSNHENASNALFEEISKLFQQTPTEPEPQPEERENLEEEATTVDDGQLDIFTAIESVEAATGSRYETAAEIEAALADKDEVDTHLMAIASTLDSCPATEVPGRVCFFVQNIPTEFDDRILGYLPKSIRPEWDRQRTALEEEARASILPPTSVSLVLGVGDLVETPTGLVGHITDVTYNAKEGGRIATVALPNSSTGEFDVATLRYIGKYQAPAPEFKVGDFVELYNGEIVQVTQTKDIDGKIYVEVNGKDAYRNTDLKPAQAPAEVKGEVVAPVAAATTKKIQKPKAKPGTASEILKCKTWGEIRAIANNDPKVIREAATSAKTKSEKELIENLPEMIRQWQMDNRDFSDFDWMPTYLTQRVRALLSTPGTAA